MTDRPEVVADLGYATLDLDRETRQGVPEVVYGPGKSVEQIVGIATALLERSTGPVLATRVDDTVATEISTRVTGSTYDPRARLLTWRARPVQENPVRVAVVTAGTADGPVAHETVGVCTALGHAVTPIEDVGVAGLHRLLRRLDDINAADVVVVIAGMEAALASVVGGLVEVPVVAVPTSTGYGTSLEGVTALLGMLAGCAAGVTVVGIDNGFGAALAVHRLTRALTRRGDSDRQPAHGDDASGTQRTQL